MRLKTILLFARSAAALDCAGKVGIAGTAKDMATLISRLLTQSEVCRILGVCPKTLQLLRKKRKIAALRFGHRTIRFRSEEVERFIRKAKPRP